MLCHTALFLAALRQYLSNYINQVTDSTLITYIHVPELAGEDGGCEMPKLILRNCFNRLE